MPARQGLPLVAKFVATILARDLRLKKKKTNVQVTAHPLKNGNPVICISRSHIYCRLFAVCCSSMQTRI